MWGCSGSGEQQRIGNGVGLIRGPGSKKSPGTAGRTLDTLAQPTCVPAFNRAWPVTTQGNQMTTTKTSRAAAPGPLATPVRPVAYFSDEASTVARPLPGSARRLSSPLETLTWQEPPASEEGADEPR